MYPNALKANNAQLNPFEMKKEDSSSAVVKTPTFSFVPIDFTGARAPSIHNHRCTQLAISLGQPKPRRLCVFEHWAFSSCGVATLHNFKSYSYAHDDEKIVNPNAPSHVGYGGKIQPGYYSNWELLELFHEDLFKWLWTNVPFDCYNPHNYLMVLSDSQVAQLPKMLSHTKVRKVDTWMNQSHGPSRLHVYRISLNEDWMK